MESKQLVKLLPSNNVVSTDCLDATIYDDVSKNNGVLVMELNYAVPKTVLRDFNNHYEICLDGYSSDED